MALSEKIDEFECIENFLYEFPFQDQEGISGILASRAELKRWALKETENPPSGRGKFFHHQIIIQRILRMFETQLLMAEMGTGKTCSVIGYTEIIAGLVAHPFTRTNFKHVYIITGYSIKREIKDQIVCKCSEPGKYDTESINAIDSEEAQRAQVTKLLNTWYTVCTYDSFIKIVLKKIGYTNLFYKREISKKVIDELAAELSDCIIWIDEVHEMRVKPNNLTTNKKLQKDKEYRYTIFHKVLHLILRSKIILSSATPIINYVHELGPILNLILPLDKQLDYDFNWDATTVEELEPYLQGQISFVRGLQNENVELIEMGDYTESLCDTTDSKYPLKLFISQMSEFQSAAYERSIDKDNTTREEERNAALFVFPDGEWGTGTTQSEKQKLRQIRKIRQRNKQERLNIDVAVDDKNIKLEEITYGDDSKSFRRYITHVKDDLYRRTKLFDDAIKTLEDIRKYSCIFYDIIRIEDNESGCGYVFLNYIGGGAIPLAMCLEAIGWSRFYETKSIFVTNEYTRNYCKEGANNSKQLRNKFILPQKRYALLTGSTPDSQVKAMTEAWNSYENRNGDIIKLFIVTPTGKQGLSLNHVLRIHNDPMWSWSEIIQAIARALRITSHNYLEGRQIIRLYRHVAMSASGQSIGCYMYHRAVAKNIKIGQVMRMLKILASDCNLNHKRNIRVTDVPGTDSCDYQNNCNYNCLYKPVDWVDYSAADNLYLSDTINDLIPLLQSAYLEKNSYSYLDLYDMFPDFTERQIDLVVSYAINNYITFIDLFGYNNYLREDHGIFYITRGFPKSVSHYHSNFYNQVLIAVDYRNDLDMIASNIFGNNNIDLNTIDFTELDHIKGQGKIFEDAYINGNQRIIEHYRHMFHIDNEGIVTHWINIRDDKTSTRHGRLSRIRSFKGFRTLYPGEDKWIDDPGYTNDNFDQYFDRNIYGIMDIDQLLIVDKTANIEGKNYDSINIRELFHILFVLLTQNGENVQHILPEDVAENDVIKMDKTNLAFLEDKSYEEKIFFNSLLNFKEDNKKIYASRTEEFYEYFLNVFDGLGLVLYF